MDLSQYSEEQLAYIIKIKDETDLSWTEIAEKYNKKFKENKYCESLRKCYHRNKNYFDQKDAPIKTLKQIQQTKKNSSNVAKENKIIIDHLLSQDGIIEAIQNAVKEISLTKYKVPKSNKDNKKELMTLEALISDVHFGKLVLGKDGNVLVDCQEIRRRTKKISNQIIKEIDRNSKYFNVERLVVGVLGDLVESSHIHGAESEKGSEFGTSRQIFECVQSLYQDFLLPLAMTGIKIDLYCVSGNHDRLTQDKTYVRPGEDNLTYVIYKVLELLCKNSTLTNITFNTTSKNYICTKIYNDLVVYEHGDELKNLNRDTMINLMNKRQNQIGDIVNFYRVGHWHEYICYGQGKIQVNGCVFGQDDYSEIKGFNSEALQVLNYYVKTNKRKTSFFRSFPIYLEENKK